MHEHYHEAFWVVTGTAAPVIALAVVVAIPDLADVRYRVPAAVWEKGKAARWAMVGTYAAFFDFMLMAYLLPVSLWSIANGKNEIAPSLAVTLATVGVILVFISTATAIFGRQEGDVSDGSPPESGDGNVPDDDQPGT